MQAAFDAYVESYRALDDQLREQVHSLVKKNLSIFGLGRSSGDLTQSVAALTGTEALAQSLPTLDVTAAV